ncbi:MAG: hypothetical protein O3B41_07010 [Bacteroidetes bacterium]|nr:hypothetical protein [Bacteroidota bacterium]
MSDVTSGNLTKEDLELRLKEKGQAISSRFEAYESKIPQKMPSLLSVVKLGPKYRVGLAVGAGLLLGVILFRRKSAPKAIKYDDGLNKLSNQLASRVADLLKKGSDSDDAVRQAFQEQPPLMRLSPDTEGVLSTALKQVMQAGVSMIGAEVAGYLRNRLRDKS